MIRERIDGIIVMCCLRFKITPEQFFSRKRNRKFSDARKVAYQLMRECLKMRFKDIGDFIDRKHSTIVHMTQTIRYDRSTLMAYAELRQKYNRVYKLS